VISLFDDLTIFKNKNPIVVVVSRHVNEVGKQATYKSALAMVYKKARRVRRRALDTEIDFTESR
jgi:hypothetical protein